MIINTPALFDYHQCLHYIGRSNLELIYQVEGDKIFKLLEMNGRKILCSVASVGGNGLEVEFLNDQPTDQEADSVFLHIREWFDLDTDLSNFYETVAAEPLFSKLTERYRGLRLIKIPDFFEAMSWAVIGQQINLRFAYQIKKALIEQYAERLQFLGRSYYLFPKPETVANLTVEDLKGLQFSRQKATYLIGIAQALLRNEISKENLKLLPYADALAKLKTLKGIGNWSANYVLMRSIGTAQAVPLQDAGLKNALKRQLELDKAPTPAEVHQIVATWKQWQAYRTFYLWRSLIGEKNRASQ